jgi:hypothetical protein
MLAGPPGRLRIWPPSLLLGGGVVLWALIFGASFYNLANYPTLWSDEAIFSETAANLVQQGRYAFTVQSPDQLSDLDFRISVGPVVILPVALAYRLLGVEVGSGRLVAGAYLFLSFLALFLGARRLWGSGPALGAVFLALVATDVLYWGRAVLGDVPALSLFLLGTWLLVGALEGATMLPAFLGGLCLGLAFDAKEFYGLTFLPPLVVLAWNAWGDRGRLARQLLAYLAGLTLPLLGYLLLKVLILGDFGAAVYHFLRQKALLCHEFFTPLTIGRLYPESLAFLLGHPLFWLGVLGAGLRWRETRFRPGEVLWVSNFALWSLIYLTAVYWQRFALPALFLAAPLAACFIREGVARLTADLGGAPRWLAPGLLAAFLVLLCPLPGVELLGPILNRQADAPYRLLHYLQTKVPPQCLIETPEYELAFLDDEHHIHLMPSYFFLESTPKGVVLLNPRPQPYDFERVGADFLVLGSFGKSVFRQIYPPARLVRDWRRIAQVDYYDIYVRRNLARKTLHKKPRMPRPKSKWTPGVKGSSPSQVKLTSY